MNKDNEQREISPKGIIMNIDPKSETPDRYYKLLSEAIGSNDPVRIKQEYDRIDAKYHEIYRRRENEVILYSSVNPWEKLYYMACNAMMNIKPLNHEQS